MCIRDSAYAKADTGKEHTEDDAWIRANIGTIQHAMLSEPNMGEMCIRDRVRIQVLRFERCLLLLAQAGLLDFHNGGVMRLVLGLKSR